MGPLQPVQNQLYSARIEGIRKYTPYTLFHILTRVTGIKMVESLPHSIPLAWPTCWDKNTWTIKKKDNPWLLE